MNQRHTDGYEAERLDHPETRRRHRNGAQVLSSAPEAA